MTKIKNILYVVNNMHAEIRKYCEHIRKAHIEVRRFNKKDKTWYWDLPAMASICHDGHYSNMKRGFSHRPEGSKWVGVLVVRLKTILGRIGEHSIKGKRYIIGNCSEQHAANNYISHYHENDVNNLYFSEAVRPRTMQVYEPCDNCKAIFPTL